MVDRARERVANQDIRAGSRYPCILGWPGSTELVELAKENNAKHYGEVIACQHILSFKDCEDTKEARRVFKKTNLFPRLEIAAGRFAFWRPDDAKYRTQSQPEQ